MINIGVDGCMPDQELNEIEARANRAIPGPHNPEHIYVSQCDVIPLIAEVRQLKAERDLYLDALVKHHQCPYEYVGYAGRV